MRLLPGVFFIGVDVIAGQSILAASEWVVTVTAAPSLCNAKGMPPIGEKT
jgi:hypothetical protein